MGGLLIIFSTLIPVLLFTDLGKYLYHSFNCTTLWMGSIGFLDDYIKVFKKDKKGLQGKFKDFWSGWAWHHRGFNHVFSQ